MKNYEHLFVDMNANRNRKEVVPRRSSKGEVLVAILGAGLLLNYMKGYMEDHSKPPVREDYINQSAPAILNNLNHRICDSNGDGLADILECDGQTISFDTNQISGSYAEGLLSTGAKRMTPAQVKRYTRILNEYNLNRFKIDSLKYKNEIIKGEGE